MLEIVSAATDLDLISYLKAIPDARKRRGVRIPAWYLLLVAVLGIFEPLPEPAGSGTLCHPPPRRAYKNAELGAAPPTIGFLVSLLLPPG